MVELKSCWGKVVSNPLNGREVSAWSISYLCNTNSPVTTTSYGEKWNNRPHLSNYACRKRGLKGFSMQMLMGSSMQT